MKKVMFALLTVTLLFGTFALAAGPNGSMSASKSVTLKAIVPEYLGLQVYNATPVMFDFRGKDSARNIAGGQHNGVNSLSNPSWGLTYNLRINRTVTVCAYATDFTGTTSGTDAIIRAGFLSGVSLEQGRSGSFGPDADCTTQTGALLLDKLQTGNGATSTGNMFGIPRVEGFSSMFLTPSAGSDGSYVPTPDTYRGRLTIVVQAI